MATGFEGCIPKSWIETQACYLLFIKCNKNLLRWVSALIVKMWQIAWNMWELRNSAEHENDDKLLLDTLNLEIELLITKYEGRSDGPLHPSELAKVRSATIPYKRAWISNLHAAEARAARKSNSDTTIQSMRSIMRQFLSSGQ
jgi:hypothetical protein